MDLHALSDFNVVAIHGGFGAASRATGRPKATLSRRVRELEDALGVRLIERGARPFRLTGEGAVLHEETRAMLGRIDEVAGALAGDAGAPRGKLRVSAPVLFAHRGLGRLAARFAKDHSGIELEVVAEDRFVDPLKEGFDVVVRANPEPDTALAGRCFLRDRLVVVAATSIPRPKEGEACPAIILPSGRGQREWRIVSGKRVITVVPREVLCLSSMAMIFDAVREGAGAAMVPASLVRKDIEADRLVEWGEVAGRPIEVWALYAPQRHVSRKVSAFIAMLVDSFEGGSPAFFDTL